MPRVPLVDGQRVAEAPLQGGQQRSGLQANTFQNTQGAEIGRALVDATAQIQERTDADMVMRAESEIKAKWMEWEGEAKQRRGQQAWGVAKEAGQWWDDNANKAAEGLSSPTQKALFQRTVMQLRGHSVGAFSGYEAGQRRESLDESAQASIVGSINMAAANPTDTVLHQATKADIVKRNAMRAKINGWDPVMAEAKQAEYLTNFHKQVIQGLVVQDPLKAEAYFEANKGEIAGTQHAEVGAFAMKATAARLGDTAAEAIWQTAGPKGDREPVQVDVLLAKAREQLQGRPEAMEAAVKGLKERAAAFKDGRHERAEQLEAGVNQAILDGATPAQIRSMPDFLKLPPESARKISDFLERRELHKEQVAASRASRAAANESRADAAEARAERRKGREGTAAYLVYSNPDTLNNMTESQVLNLLPTLGNELTTHLMSQKRALGKNPAKLAEARMDADDFNHVARQMGLPIDDKSTPEQKEAKGELRYRIEQMIDVAQQGGKKTLTRAEKLDLVRREVARTVTVDPGLFSANREVPVIALTRDQVARVVVPPSDRRQLADAMRTMYERTGRVEFTPSDENLKRFYLSRKTPAADMILPPK